MKDFDFDVIVVGAGPAGAICSYTLARRGLAVLLLEREKLPRYKPCGGALSIKARELLDFNLEGIIEAEIYSATFSYKNERSITTEKSTPYTYMIMRDKFDYFLTQKACAAGVQLKEGTRVIDIIESEEQVEIVTEDGNSFNSRVVVGADGIFSTVARKTGLNKNIKRAVAIEGELPVSETFLKDWEKGVSIEVGSVSPGYGWIFPKKGHLSIGVAQFKEKAEGLKDLFFKFLSEQGLEFKDGMKFSGHLIPVAGKIKQISKNRVLLVGDAAGLVDPLSGEGIYYALKSGIIAARVTGSQIKKGKINPGRYQELIREEFASEFRIAQKLSRLFYFSTSIIYSLIEKKPEIIDYLLQLVYGEIEYRSFFTRIKDYLVFKRSV